MVYLNFSLPCLLWLIFPAIYPAPVVRVWHSWDHGAVEKYLQQLSNYYRHCHINQLIPSKQSTER